MMERISRDCEIEAGNPVPAMELRQENLLPIVPDQVPVPHGTSISPALSVLSCGKIYPAVSQIA